MRLVRSLSLSTLFICASLAYASLDFSAPVIEKHEKRLHCVATGQGIIAAPYMEEFQWLLLTDQHFLYFVFSFPLDPGHKQEVDDFQIDRSLDWEICQFEVETVQWTGISAPIMSEALSAPQIFLAHLRQLSFFDSLRPISQ